MWRVLRRQHLGMAAVTDLERKHRRSGIQVRQGRINQGLLDAETALRQGAPTALLLWNDAHVYAQLAAAPGVPNPVARTRYQEQAVELLGKAMALAPERKKFWQDKIAADALLDPVRGNAGFQRLEREYGKTPGPAFRAR